MSETHDTKSMPAAGQVERGLGPLVVSPCLACPTPGRCTDTDKCATPKKGEVWHILRDGAAACDTVTIAEITARTVLFEPKVFGIDGERLPLRQGLQFVERVKGPNVMVRRPQQHEDKA